MEKALNHIFQDSISPIIVDFYYTTEEYKDFNCVFSNDPDRNQDKTISIYDTPSMLRTLALKSEMFSIDLREKMYSTSDPELCFVLEWNDKIRKIILFNLKRLNKFEEDQFVDCLAAKRDELYQLFEQILEQQGEN